MVIQNGSVSFQCFKYRYSMQTRVEAKSLPPYAHPTSVNALSTLSPLPSQRLRDASSRWPYREVADLCEEGGSESTTEGRDIVVLSFGSDARIILRAVEGCLSGMDVSNNR
jgi:hypothetical protein